MTQQTTNRHSSPEADDGKVNGIHMETLLGTVNAIS